MRLLLDTHVLLWWLAEDERLKKPVRKMIADAERVYVSAASVWEIAVKTAAGKLRAPEDLEAQLEASRFLELPVTIAHARAAAILPALHKDPFDRMLVAQASIEAVRLLTGDAMLSRYDHRVMLV
jgi:PIN domain nuclease of toxin-antitoxin system